MGPKFRVGDWQVEPDLNHLVQADRTVQIEPKVMDVLAFLASHPGEVCPKDTIIKAVWPDTFVSDDVLAYSISELRKAFGDSAKDPSVIATIAKRGYRLIAPVSRLQDTAKAEPVGSAVGKWTALLTRKSAVALLSVMLVLILLMWYMLTDRNSEMTQIGMAPTVAATSQSIAVVPFENLSPDPQNSFFADGFTEDLINQLSKIGHLRVMSRAAVARYRDDPAISQVEKDLGVDMILKGSIRREGDRVRISTQLIEAKTGRHLWGETYDRELAGVFRIQSEVARSVAAALNVRLSATEQGQIQKQPTANLTAYDYYLKGREYYRRYRNHDNENAIELFEKALELDPDLALAHAGLADCYAQKNYQFGFPAVWTDRALEASRKALSTDPDLAEAHKAFGFVHAIRGQLREALKAYYRAVELNPNYSAPITNIAVILEQQGKFVEALQWTTRALSLDPAESIAYFNVGDVYRDLHDLDRAEAWFKKALSLNPDYEPAHLAMSRLYIVRKNYPEALEESRKVLSLDSTSVRGLSAAGHVYLASGDIQKAGEYYRRALAGGPNQNAAIRLSRILWKQGAREEAHKLFEPLIRESQRAIDRGDESWRGWWVIAVVRALQGDTREALSSLEKAAAAGWRPGAGAWDDPEYENLLEDRRFRSLMAALKEDVDQQRRRALLLVTPPQ
jgi:TolB-like protein/DNA-binding winged helix-turn-helix (wHTH) protein/lipopolysaccharide biosynthesis regulator YciM